jgi:hypothetical protein
VLISMQKTANSDYDRFYTLDQTRIQSSTDDSTVVEQTLITPVNILIQGSIDSNPTKAGMTANISYTGTQVKGNIYGSIEVNYGSIVKKYTFKSNKLSVVFRVIKDHQQHITAVFQDIVVQDALQGSTYSPCTLNLLATKVGNSSFICSHIITLPDTSNLIVSGLHKGLLVVR